MNEEEKKKLCSQLESILGDERKASVDYVVLAERFDSNVPEEKMMATLLYKIAEDEHSHKNALERVTKILSCPI